MPAAAVIPAPIAYIKVVAVKKLVVGFRGPGRSLRFLPACLVGAWRASVSESDRSAERRVLTDGPCCLSGCPPALNCCGRGVRDVYFEQIRVFQAGRLL